MALKELKQKGEILMVRLKCTQDSEQCYRRTALKSAEYKVRSILIPALDTHIELVLDPLELLRCVDGVRVHLLDRLLCIVHQLQELGRPGQKKE